MSNFGVAVNPQREAAVALARRVIDWAGENGHKVRFVSSDAEVVGRPDLGCKAEAFAAGLDLVVSLGGDGTMLRTVDRVVHAGVPILGVNVGQLGYLTTVEPDEMEDALGHFATGEYEIDERMLVQVRLDAPSLVGSGITGDEALNEVVVEKTPMGHTVRIAVSFDGDFFTTYAADGLIVATPTGSTAYSFSARGPIVAPGHHALIVTPVSPHMLFDRPLVLEPSMVIRLEVIGGRPAALSADGRALGVLAEGDAIVCTSADQSARLVRFGGRGFHQILKAKFGLNDR